MSLGGVSAYWYIPFENYPEFTLRSFLFVCALFAVEGDILNACDG
jgi:hypothetical protein